MAFTIRQLQFFVAVAEAGTISHAAQVDGNVATGQKASPS